jgi:CheY-like chemotaxis protein
MQGKILVVDDNVDSAISLAELLKLMGGETQTAHDGLEAIEVAERFHPDVILMDVGMPKLNGYDAARRIREQPWGETIAVIAITGRDQDDDHTLSQQSGCIGHLVKPVKLNELERMLTQVFANRA